MTKFFLNNSHNHILVLIIAKIHCYSVENILFAEIVFLPTYRYILIEIERELCKFSGGKGVN